MKSGLFLPATVTLFIVPVLVLVRPARAQGFLQGAELLAVRDGGRPLRGVRQSAHMTPTRPNLGETRVLPPAQAPQEPAPPEEYVYMASSQKGGPPKALHQTRAAKLAALQHFVTESKLRLGIADEVDEEIVVDSSSNAPSRASYF